MAPPAQVLRYLDRAGIKYRLVEHRKVYTAWDASQTQHLDPRTVVKSLVVRLDTRPVLVLLAAAQRLDFNKFKQVVNRHRRQEREKAVKKVSLVTEAFLRKLPGQLGSIPPFGGLLGMPVWMDNSLRRKPKLSCPSGDNSISIELSTKAYLRLETPQGGSFGKMRRPQRAKKQKKG
jgi:prolyl-tRNA editing enzyme YbaK/EbsC (Cys-tRNA(Pro) deacylase)